MIDLRAITAADINEIRPIGGFGVIIADPAWRFQSNSDAKPGRSARRHYPTMTLAEIMAMPVCELASKNSLLLLWATVPMLTQGLDVLKAWGFKYKSQLVWDKKRIGTGYWARNRHEIVLIGRRGKFPCQRPALFDDSVIEEMRREHSRKPELPQQVIDARYPEVAKLELFARRPRDGWVTLGNQSEKFERAA